MWLKALPQPGELAGKGMHLSRSDLDGSSYLSLVERLENGSIVPECRT